MTAVRKAHVYGALMALAYFFMLKATAPDLAMSRDEGFYVSAAESYGQWMEAFAKSPRHALRPDVIEQHWGNNHEHPSVMKMLFAVSWTAHKHAKWFSTDSEAHRFFAMVCASLLVWLIVVFGARAKNLGAGVMAGFFFATLPRPFYHAHLNAFDVPIAFFMTLTTYAYWRSLRSSRWVWATGLSFGLALGTKHNSWALPILFLIHWVWWRVHQHIEHGGRARLKSWWPGWLAAMLVIGPLVFVALWPWLWHDTGARIREYVAFHVNHEYYNMAYFGQNYFRPPFPMSYPWVMTLFTVPCTTLALSWGGVLAGARRWFPLRRGNPAPATDACVDVLWLGSLLTPLVIISLPSTPIFGGTKHWFPAYPFLSLFAGVGAWHVLRAVGETVAANTNKRSFVTRIAVTVGAALVLAPGFVQTAHSHPFGLSHYTPVAGGVPGAATLGMNRQFWGFTTGSLVPYFRKQMPQGGTVWICDTTWESWQMLVRDGKLPANIQATGDLGRADYAMVHHEHHFAEVDFQIWVAFGTVQPDYVLTYDGVPIISVYKNPRPLAVAD